MRNLLLAVLVVAGCSNGVNGDSGAAACITASACGIFTLGTSLCTQAVEFVNEPGVEAGLHISATQVNCLASAGSNCDAARACLNGGMKPDACSGTSNSCNGNTLKICDGLTGINGADGTRQFDCGVVGAGYTCITGAAIAGSAAIDCGLASCNPNPLTGSPLSCTDSNTLQSCVRGIQAKTDCSRDGETCVPASGLTPAHCEGAGAGCASKNNGDSSLRCDGNSLVSCNGDHEAKVDCGRDNLKCLATFVNGGNVPNPQYGCYLGSECDPNNYSASCSGLSLTFCNKGKHQTVECGQLGFNGCDPTNGGRCTKS